MRKAVPVATPRRRERDRRQEPDRRGGGIRALLDPAGIRIPGRFEQMLQYFARYLFCILALIFFNIAFPEPPRLLPRELLNIAFCGYLVANTAFFIHAWRYPDSVPRYRITMALDIAMVSMALVADPNNIPPSGMAYIMIALGNGLRYGLRLFAEAVLGCFAGAMLALTLRFLPAEGLHPGLLFINIFGGIILAYSYILMARVEATRRGLEQAVNLDGLTGLVNRRGLEAAPQRLFADTRHSGQPFCVMFADIDNLKAVNDLCGHAEGDQVLRQFGHIVRSSVRECDLAGRYGGDEFVLMLPGINRHEAREVAERLRGKVAAWARDNGLDCSVSIGIGEVPVHGDDLDTVMRRVDEAMYATKRSGTGVHCLADDPVEALDPESRPG